MRQSDEEFLSTLEAVLAGDEADARIRAVIKRSARTSSNRSFADQLLLDKTFGDALRDKRKLLVAQIFVLYPFWDRECRTRQHRNSLIEMVAASDGPYTQNPATAKRTALDAHERRLIMLLDAEPEDMGRVLLALVRHKLVGQKLGSDAASEKTQSETGETDAEAEQKDRPAEKNEEAVASSQGIDYLELLKDLRNWKGTINGEHYVQDKWSRRYAAVRHDLGKEDKG